MNAKDFPNTAALMERIQSEHMDILGALLGSDEWESTPSGAKYQRIGNVGYIVQVDGRIERLDLDEYGFIR